MATIKQLTKQVESSQKRIEDYTKKITMYQTRAKKNAQKFGVDYDQITYAKNRYGYDITLPIKLEFWDSEKITNAYQYMLENCEKLEREKSYLAKLTDELTALQETEKAEENAFNNGLALALNNAMSDFKTEWTNKMISWHDSHYDYIKENYDKARDKNSRSETLLTRIRWWKKYSHHRLFSYTLERIAKETRIIINDRANFFTEKYDYMNEVADNLQKLWDNSIKNLTKKCQAFCIDESQMKLSNIAVTPKGFEVYITDGKPRRVYARMIWAAEDSILVTPHTRYIVTEKKK